MPMLDFSDLAPKQSGGSPSGLIDFSDLAPKRTALEQAGHTYGVAARHGQQGAIGGPLSLLGMVGDAFAGVGRDVAAGTNYLASQTGLVDYDPRTYYPEGGSPTERGTAAVTGADNAPTAFPAVAAAQRVGRMLPDALGLPEPETQAERLMGAGVEGLTGGILGGPVGMAAGTTSGLASQGAAEAGYSEPVQVAAGAVAGGPFGFRRSPVPRGQTRVRAGTPEGQDVIAGEVLRRAAGRPTNSAAEARQAIADARQNLMTMQPQTPGYQFTAPAASRSQGLANIGQQWGNMPTSQRAELIRENSALISNEIDRLGGRPGTAAMTRERANDAARTDRPAALAQPAGESPTIDITPILNDLRAGTRLRGTGTTSEAADARNAMIEVLRDDRARPRVRVKADGRREIVGYDITLEALAAARDEIASARFSKTGNLAPTTRNARLQAGGAQTASHLDELDALLNDYTGDAWGAYLTRQREMRSLADRQGTMEEIGKRADRRRGGDLSAYEAPMGPSTSSRDISDRGFLAAMPRSVREARRPMGGEAGSGSFAKLEPEQRSFLRGASRDMQQAAFENSGRTSGSSTAKNFQVDREIAEAVTDSRSTAERMKARAGSFLDLGSYAFTRAAGGMGGGPFAGAAANLASRGLADAMQAGTARRMSAQVEGVQGALGRAYTRPQEAARLMGLPEPYKRGPLSQRAARLIARGGFLSMQGALEGDRTARYR